MTVPPTPTHRPAPARVPDMADARRRIDALDASIDKLRQDMRPAVLDSVRGQIIALQQQGYLVNENPNALAEELADDDLPARVRKIELLKRHTPHRPDAGMIQLQGADVARAVEYANGDTRKYDEAIRMLREGKPVPIDPQQFFATYLDPYFPGATVKDAVSMIGELEGLDPPAGALEIQGAVLTAFNDGIRLGDVIQKHRDPMGFRLPTEPAPLKRGQGRSEVAGL